MASVRGGFGCGAWVHGYVFWSVPPHVQAVLIVTNNTPSLTSFLFTYPQLVMLKKYHQLVYF
jgi:hypothetical protein